MLEASADSADFESRGRNTGFHSHGRNMDLGFHSHGNTINFRSFVNFPIPNIPSFVNCPLVSVTIKAFTVVAYDYLGGNNSGNPRR